MTRTTLLVVPFCLMALADESRAWNDVSGSAELTTNAKALDRSAGVLFSYASVRNESGAAMQDLRLTITDPSVPVDNPDGWTGNAEPYFDLPPLQDGESATTRIEFPLARLRIDYGLRLEELPPPAAALTITAQPSLTMNPSGNVPLSGLITATTNIPARAKLTAVGTTDSFEVEFHEFATDHSLELLGLRLDSSYTVDVTFTDRDDNSVAGTPVVAVTGSLPVEAPDIDVLVNVPAQKEPGYTWVDAGGAVAFAFVFDKDAEIVWYNRFNTGGATRKLPNGNLSWLSGTTAVERDIFIGIASDTELQLPGHPGAQLHHDLFPTIYGTFLSLDREFVMVDDYPTSTTDPNAPTATKELRDEPIIEFRTDGTLLKRWPLVDVIEPTRVYWGSGNAEPIDWAHTNSIVHDPRDDSVIVSVRHQSCVIKVDRVTGRLKWILGNPSNWSPEFEALRLQPVGPIDWQYYQHAAMITPNGNLLLFDNGNSRNSPFDPFPSVPETENASGAVEFAIDEENLQVTQVWEWTGDFVDRIYSRFLSDADSLPQTGNVLIDFGGTSFMGGVSVEDLGYGRNVVRLIEVTHDTPAQVVMDIQISDPVEQVTAYRTEHWSSLYPPYATRTDF
jgi:arylsulfate sulfotransferase